MFIQRGNRHLVNCFVTTEASAWVYVFSRGGLHYLARVNIYACPETFVKFALGAADECYYMLKDC